MLNLFHYESKHTVNFDFKIEDICDIFWNAKIVIES